MRFRNLACALFVSAVAATLFVGYSEAQAGAGSATQPKAQTAAKSSATAPLDWNLAQVMRGILFPNSNVIFWTQSHNPADVKPAENPTSATDPLYGTYGGWTAVENSAIALSEAANLLTVPGRVCSNGRPVPINNPDWRKFVQGLRDAGKVTYKAAQSKDQDKVVDAAEVVTNACGACHEKYRDKPGGVANRCM